MNFSAGVNNGNEGLYWLEQLRNAAPYVQVVLFTAYADIDLAVKESKPEPPTLWSNRGQRQIDRHPAIGLSVKSFPA